MARYDEDDRYVARGGTTALGIIGTTLGGASIPTFPAILENGRFLHTNALTGALEYVTVVLLPDVTTEDNGKILTVVNGVWTAQSPT